ncbi:hypothetical protein DXB39_10340, partial [Roseburia sp. OM03-7AC]|uniref:hypothetical protein n=1 Tax=Roseburia sp. OM03-7AC TaxID=2293140 RepID=UPI000E8E48C9
GFRLCTLISAISRYNLTSIGIKFADESTFGSGTFFSFVVVRFRVINIGNTRSFIELFYDSYKKHLLSGYEFVITHNTMKCKKKWQKTAIFQGFLSVFINEMWLRDRTSGWGLNSNKRTKIRYTRDDYRTT